VKVLAWLGQAPVQRVRELEEEQLALVQEALLPMVLGQMV
jgi:hypothetical protein